MKLSIDGEVLSLFAEGNLTKNIYKSDAMKTKVSNHIDLFIVFLNLSINKLINLVGEVLSAFRFSPLMVLRPRKVTFI